MDYQRRDRQVTYHSPSCKMYLRHDFEHRCAYCGAVEEILSPVPSARELLFEKDHFVPQDSGASDVHKYPNLYYACKKCNGLKDNLRLPLDPCIDDIWFGDNPQLKIGDASKGFFVDPQTPAAEQYAEILQLNSRYQLEVREEFALQITRKKEQEQILSQLEAYPGLDPSLVSQIRTAMAPASPLDCVDSLCGSSSWGRKMAAAYNQLVSLGYTCQLTLGDAPCDIVITIDEITYHAEIRIDQEPHAYRLPCNLLASWQEKYPHVGIIKYIPESQKLHFYKIDFHRSTRRRKLIWLKTMSVFRHYV